MIEVNDSFWIKSIAKNGGKKFGIANNAKIIYSIKCKTVVDYKKKMFISIGYIVNHYNNVFSPL